MELREIRGLEIANTLKIRREGNVWIVPSQTRPKQYTVNLFLQTCTCPDFDAHRTKCKHIYAAEATLAHESGSKLPLPKRRRSGHINRIGRLTMRRRRTRRRSSNFYCMNYARASKNLYRKMVARVSRLRTLSLPPFAKSIQLSHADAARAISKKRTPRAICLSSPHTKASSIT